MKTTAQENSHGYEMGHSYEAACTVLRAFPARPWTLHAWVPVASFKNENAAFAYMRNIKGSRSIPSRHTGIIQVCVRA